MTVFENRVNQKYLTIIYSRIPVSGASELSVLTLTILIQAHVTALCAERLEASSVRVRATGCLRCCYSHHGGAIAIVGLDVGKR